MTLFIDHAGSRSKRPRMVSCWSGAAHILAPKRLRRTGNEDVRYAFGAGEALRHNYRYLQNSLDSESRAGRRLRCERKTRANRTLKETTMIRTIDREKERSNAS
jgi:hypothetical protein